jgi:chromosome segregation ATPase
MRPKEEMSQIEILDEEIASLKSRIKNTEYDLLNSFKGNSFINQKLISSKKQLEEKEKKRLELNEILEKNKEEFKKVEEKLNETPLSKAQADEIIEEVKQEMS